MNLPKVKALYSDSLDVRRVDMAIGEKAYWGKGIGTELIRMLLGFAFYGENVDALHCFCENYNDRSCRTFEKLGFAQILAEPLPQPQKGQWQYHYRLTKRDFIECRRTKAHRDLIFKLPIKDIQPSQLYISEGKLSLVNEWFDSDDKSSLDPIPVKHYNGKYLMTDGHTRAVAAYAAGWNSVPVTWDDDPLDMLAYAEYVRWCKEAGINSVIDLSKRIIPFKDYEILWRKRCLCMKVRRP